MTDLTWVLSSCALILAVIALRAAFGKRMRPGLRYALWGLVLLRLLYPGTVLSSPVSVQGVAEQSEVVRNFEVLRGVDTIEYMDIDSSENSGYIVCPKREGMSLEWGTPERFERMQTTLKVRDVLEPIWFAGIAITSIVFLVSNLRFYAQLRKRRKPLETNCPLRVYSVENLSSSCLFGNAIYVAADTAADETKLRHVLAHELSHHRHGDHVWALLRCVALALHWYNPLVWWAAALSRQDSELCADAGALERLGEAERENYGATLIELSARRAPRSPLLCAATTMTNGKKSLKERVTMIARRPRMTVAVVIAVVLIATVAAGCAFTGAAEQENEATTETQTELPTPEPSKESVTTNESDNAEELEAFAQRLNDERPQVTLTLFDSGAKGSYDGSDTDNGWGYCHALLDHTYTRGRTDEAPQSDHCLRLEALGCRLDFYGDYVLFQDQNGTARGYFSTYNYGPDVFTPNLEAPIRGWYDEAEFLALGGGYDQQDQIVIPDRGQSYLEAAQEHCEVMENLHLQVSSGSKYRYTFVKPVVEAAEEQTAWFRSNGEIDENTWCVELTMIFAPENENARNWGFAGNTVDYDEYVRDYAPEAYDSSVPDGSCICWRVGYVTKEADGWHTNIVGTGW